MKPCCRLAKEDMERWMSANIPEMGAFGTNPNWILNQAAITAAVIHLRYCAATEEKCDKVK